MPAPLTEKIVEEESKGLSNEKIRPYITADHSLSQKLMWMNNSRIEVRFKGSYVKQHKLTFTPRNVVNLFIVYEWDTWSQDLNADFTVKDNVWNC